MTLRDGVALFIAGVLLALIAFLMSRAGRNE